MLRGHVEPWFWIEVCLDWLERLIPKMQAGYIMVGFYADMCQKFPCIGKFQ